MQILFYYHYNLPLLVIVVVLKENKLYEAKFNKKEIKMIIIKKIYIIKKYIL